MKQEQLPKTDFEKQPYQGEIIVIFEIGFETYILLQKNTLTNPVLIGYAVALALQFIIAAQSLIQWGDFLVSHGCTS